jgi:acyl-[acyl-carrier-protein]-phospholipid O-acyltransferase/long-chain-fatty-acid--[acyl-carrier-protein] ligase
MRRVWSLLLRLLFRVRVVGDLNVFDRADRLIIVSRLASPLDAVMLALFLPRHPVVIVPPEAAAGRVMRWMRRRFAIEALDLASAATLKRILQLTRAGSPVAFFPHGRVALEDVAMKIYPVAAAAAVWSGATVLPVSVERSGQWLSDRARGWLGRFLPAITIRVLPSTRIEVSHAGSARSRRVQAARMLDSVMREMTLLSCAFRPVFQCFLDACRRHGRSTVLVEDQRPGPRSYGQLLRMSLAVSRIVRRHTREGENVGVMLPNIAATIGVVLGLWAAGRVPAMLNYTSGQGGVRLARLAAGLRTVITSRRFLEQARLQPLVQALSDCAIVYLEDMRDDFGILDKLWLAVFALRFPHRATAKQTADQPAVVLFTSGSEGHPKGVVLSHRAIVANVAQIRIALPFTSRDKILNALPLYHAYSFTAGMVLPLITGTRLNLYLSPLHYRTIPDLFYRSDCTVLFGTSTLLSYYAAHAGPTDFVRLRYAISGGEKLSPDVARLWLEKFGVRILDGYGCTECAPVIALATPAYYRPGTVGAFLPGIEFRVEPLPGIDAGGVLHVRGPNMMLGYYLDDQPGVLRPFSSALGPGWYETGDVVEVDEDGFVTMHGRVRRFAKIAGEMVSLDQIELVAQRASSAGHRHAAILVTHETGGESTVLFTTDRTLDRAALASAARELGAHDLAVARRVIHVEALPLLGNGKTDYVALRESLVRYSPRVVSFRSAR